MNDGLCGKHQVNIKQVFKRFDRGISSVGYSLFYFHFWHDFDGGKVLKNQLHSVPSDQFG